MLKWLKQGVAKYDQWCERMGLIPENRRSCAPVRYDDGDPRKSSQRTTRLERKGCEKT